MSIDKIDVSDAKKLGVPPQVYLAFKKDNKKVGLFQTLLTETAKQDLKNPQSFLLTHYTKHRNIDPATGNDVDPGIPYYYKSELLHGDNRRIYAIAKVMQGLTGNTLVFDTLEINKLPQRSIALLAKYMQEELSKLIAHTQLTNAMKLLDPAHTKDLMRGAFYVATGAKHIEDLRGLRFLQINEVVLPMGVTVIRAHAFESVPIKKITIPKTVSRIEEYAFRGCGLESLVLPTNKYLTVLGTKAFSSNKIKKLTIPDSFNSFDFSWFEENPLEEVVAPEKIKIYNKKTGVKIYTRTKFEKGETANAQQ